MPKLKLVETENDVKALVKSAFDKAVGLFKLKRKPALPRLQCARCHRIAYSALDRAKQAHYSPHCSEDCREWVELGAKHARV